MSRRKRSPVDSRDWAYSPVDKSHEAVLFVQEGMARVSRGVQVW